MIMKMPSNNSGSYYGHDPTFDIDEDFEGINDADNFEDDFSEYLWMENEEEFDKLEMQRLEEEALMEQCIEAMLEDELEEQQLIAAEWADATDSQELCQVLSSLKVISADIEKSTLNPLAEEFVPNFPVIISPAST